MVSEHFADRWLAAVKVKGAPVCVGLDPVIERLPGALQEIAKSDPCEAIFRFCNGVMEATAPHVPAVKPQSACFERYGPAGVATLHRVVSHAKAKGLIVVLDAKRGDIGISAEHYAAGLLRPDGADALTVSPYLGPDTLEPFVKHAAAHGKGLFALVRTSNPGSDALQNLKLADGRTVAEAVADQLVELGSAYVGDSGYSLLGAVVGATKPADAAVMRERMPRQIFLVPGFGAQGGGAEDVKACFKPDGTGTCGGAMITASRSVIYAYEKAGGSWMGAIEKAAKEMCEQVRGIVGS